MIKIFLRFYISAVLCTFAFTSAAHDENHSKAKTFTSKPHNQNCYNGRDGKDGKDGQNGQDGENGSNCQDDSDD